MYISIFFFRGSSECSYYSFLFFWFSPVSLVESPIKNQCKHICITYTYIFGEDVVSCVSFSILKFLCVLLHWCLNRLTLAFVCVSLLLWFISIFMRDLLFSVLRSIFVHALPCRSCFSFKINNLSPMKACVWILLHVTSTS